MSTEGLQKAATKLATIRDYLSQHESLSLEEQQAFDLGISALNTIMDMGQNKIYLANFNNIITALLIPNVSRETLEIIAEHDCHGKECSDCSYNYSSICLAAFIDRILREEKI